MRFYAGISMLILSILLLICSIFFFDYNVLFEKLLAASLYIIVAFLFMYSIKILSIYYDYKRIMSNGLKVKAKIINVTRALVDIKDAPNYILEVIYEHPLNHSIHQTFVDALEWNKLKKSPKVNESIDVIIDPQDPNIALLMK